MSMFIKLLYWLNPFSFSYRFRLYRLKKNGIKIGKNCKIYSNTILDYSHCWHILIGDNVTLAPGVHVLAHDASTKYYLGYTIVKNTIIGNNVFIGANSIILPGVKITDNVIVGAGSVVTSDIISSGIYAGNPARFIKSLEDYLEEQTKDLEVFPKFDSSYTLSKHISNSNKNLLFNESAKSGKIFVE